MDINRPNDATAFWMGVVCAAIFIGVDFVGLLGRGSTSQAILLVVLMIVPMAIGIIGVEAIRNDPVFPLAGFTKADYLALAKRWSFLILGGLALIVPATLIRTLIFELA